jgi:carbamoyltransferase
MLILGISAFYHDSAVAIIRDGQIVAAIQEERFSRVKHDAAFPIQALRAALKHAGISIDDIDHVGFYEKPHLKLERIVATFAEYFPRGFPAFRSALTSWVKWKWAMPSLIRSMLIELSPSAGRRMRWQGDLVFAHHHMSHAASAFYPSPFSEAAILTCDGVGEWATTSLSVGHLDERGIPTIQFLKEIRYPDSIGLLYSAFTYFLGFRVNSGEYKVMGLAPYGKPRYVDRIRSELIDIRPDGSYRLNMRYFRFPYDRIMIAPQFADLFETPVRAPEGQLHQKHFDVAASIQQVTEEVVFLTASHLRELSGMSRLCMAGGVALNCVANGRIHQGRIYDDIWVQPAAGDAGGALGVGYYIWHTLMGRRRVYEVPGQDLMRGGFLGPEFGSDEIEAAIREAGVKATKMDVKEAVSATATLLAEGKVVGWFQGRMEFGPRALGARSILADPRSPEMQRRVNLKIKYRESFRPFAPAILRERVGEWFDLQGKSVSLLGGQESGYDSPYMCLVAQLNPEHKLPLTKEEDTLKGLDKLKAVTSRIPACVHVDGSARIQTVDSERNPLFHRLLTAFEAHTGVPVVLNTSFNVRGEPIVCTPAEAISCFMRTGMDALTIGSFLLIKEHQDTTNFAALPVVSPD